jgi:hypothetical protein
MTLYPQAGDVKKRLAGVGSITRASATISISVLMARHIHTVLGCLRERQKFRIDWAET